MFGVRQSHRISIFYKSSRTIFPLYNDAMKIAKVGETNRLNPNFVPATPKLAATVIICRGLKQPRSAEFKSFKISLLTPTKGMNLTMRFYL